MEKASVILWSALSYGPRVSVVRPNCGKWPADVDPGAEAVQWQRQHVPGDYTIEVIGPDDAEGLRKLGEGIVNLVEATGLPSVDLLAVEATEGQGWDPSPGPGERSVGMDTKEWEAVRRALSHMGDLIEDGTWVPTGGQEQLLRDQPVLADVLRRMGGRPESAPTTAAE